MENLENKVKWGKPDWKQWLPVYGIFQIEKDGKAGKPTVLDDSGSLKCFGSLVYQGLSIIVSVPGLFYLADKLV